MTGPEAPRGSGILRLLLIEDSQSDALLAVRTLEKAGCQVEWQRLEDEPALRAALAESEWDIILADYRLPEFDAPRALAVLQESGLDIPFIVISGAVGEETAVELMRAGACDYLLKSSLARLGPAVARELGEAQVRRERARAHQALLESEAHLRRSQQIARIGHWVYHGMTGESLWSDEMYRLYDLTPAEMAENPQVWQERIHPSDRAGVLRAMNRLLSMGQAAAVEFRIVRTDGSIRYLESTAGVPVTDHTAGVVQVSGVTQDITGRKQAEMALRRQVEESLKRARELETIAAVSARMRSAGTRAELVEVVLENLLTLLRAQFSALAFRDGEGMVFETAAGGRQVWQPQVVACSEAFVAPLLNGQNSLDLSCSDRRLPAWISSNLSAQGQVSFFPLLSGHTPIGIILIGFDRAGALNSEQLNLIAAVTAMAGNAVTRMLAREELERMVARRESELETIYQVASAATRTVDYRQAFQQALALALEAVQARNGGIFVLDEPGQPRGRFDALGLELEDEAEIEQVFPAWIFETVIRSETAQVVPDSGSGPCGPLIALPMRSHGIGPVIGVLLVRKPAGGQALPEELTVLAFIADHLALVLENARLHALAGHSAVLEERARLARELHDSVTQLLYSANLYSAGAQRFAGRGDLEKTSAHLGQIGELLQQALKEMRLLVYQLRSAELLEGGLAAALEHRLEAVERRSGIRVIFDAPADEPLDEALEEQLYRIAIEALNNSLKHARATILWITLKHRGGQVELEIGDNGCGFDPADIIHQSGVGLSSMRERAAQVGGQLAVEARPGSGVSIRVCVPLQSEPGVNR